MTLEVGDHAVIRELIRAELRGSDLAVLVRQLQGLAASGVTAVSWPGGSPYSSNVTVAHGLSGTPVPLALADLPSGGFAFEMAWVSRDATNIVYRAHATDGSSPAAGTSRSFAWAALL